VTIGSVAEVASVRCEPDKSIGAVRELFARISPLLVSPSYVTL